MKPPSAAERRLVGRFVRTFFLRNRRGKAWPVPDWLPHERLRFEGNSGADLDGRWFPVPRARGTVVLAHPDRRYGQHWFVLSGWVDSLRDAGFNVLTFDFADYGRSRGGSTYYFEDVVAAAKLARTRTPGLPIHVIGVSLGAYAVANAAPYLDFVESLVLESPYPTFNAWYGGGLGSAGMWAFDRLFPSSAALIRAPENLGRAHARRILVVASADDTITPPALSREVARGGPAARTTYLEVSGPQHLDLWAAHAAYRDAVMATLDGRPVEGATSPGSTSTTSRAAARPRALSHPSRAP